ncbi:hypothetical protein [Longimicrobium sp.]|uniref:hypothetical protein n=1 Tax=Longimicrobium sp. TaxID=2029185 RepID=UPI002E346783|nr:hypothetical protein [Longimicrobium sp.]HEX6037839.1 hypothetical protein [Longimicrobium sp.]
MTVTAAPAPSIAATILVPQDRVPRQPLGPWAAELARRTAEVLRGVRGTHALAGELAGIGNQAALIAASRGDAAVAWRLTERQLWWHGRQARRARDPGVAAWALQPWVNLGRLEALAGRWREALARFSGLGTYEMTDTVQLGCVRLHGPAWRTLTRSREQFLRFLETVYVTDTLKALLLNRQWDRVPAFAAPFADGEQRWICEEACVVAQCRAGAPRTAAARAGIAARQAQGWTRAVLRLRAAEAHACADEPQAAREILVRMARVVREVSVEQLANPSLAPVTARMAAAAQEAGLMEDAYALAGRVLQGARAARDECMQIDMLRLLADAAPERERETWAAALEAAEGTTEYARYRRGDPPSNPVISELYERLEALFSN